MKQAKSKRNKSQAFEKELGLTHNDMKMLLYGIVCMKDGKVDYTLLAQRLGGPVPSTRTMYSRAHSKLAKKLKDPEGNNNRLDMAAAPASPIAETSSMNTDAKWATNFPWHVDEYESMSYTNHAWWWTSYELPFLLPHSNLVKMPKARGITTIAWI